MLGKLGQFFRQRAALELEFALKNVIRAGQAGLLAVFVPYLAQLCERRRKFVDSGEELVGFGFDLSEFVFLFTLPRDGPHATHDNEGQEGDNDREFESGPAAQLSQIITHAEDNFLSLVEI